MRATMLLVLTTGGCLAGCGKRAETTEAPEGRQALAEVVELDSIQQAAAGLALGAIGALPPDTIHLTGIVTFDAGRVSHVGPRIQGRIRRVLVDIGTRVSAGDTLAILDSPELAAAQARWVQSRVARDVSARNFERTTRLQREGIVSERRRLEGEAEWRQHEAEFAAALQSLSALGADPDTAASGLFVIRAPLDGEIVEQHATAGEVVGPESSLFLVGALERVWLLLDLYESDLSRVKPGMQVVVAAAADPERRLEAHVKLVSSVVDTISRTVKLRVEIPNRDLHLKPGMFARASMPLDRRPGAAGIPQGAAQTLDGRDVVFVPTGRNRFRTTPVRLGPRRAGGWREVLGGAQLGDTIVVAGAFALKAEVLRAVTPEGAH